MVTDDCDDSQGVIWCRTQSSGHPTQPGKCGRRFAWSRSDVTGRRSTLAAAIAVADGQRPKTPALWRRPLLVERTHVYNLCTSYKSIADRRFYTHKNDPQLTSIDRTSATQHTRCAQNCSRTHFLPDTRMAMSISRTHRSFRSTRTTPCSSIKRSTAF